MDCFNFRHSIRREGQDLVWRIRLSVAGPIRGVVGFEEEDMNTYNIDMNSRVGERGQVTIPKRMRERLGIRSGEKVEFEEHEDFLVVRKSASSDALEGLRGLVARRGTIDDYLVSARGPAWTSELDGDR